jgi:hypothetical protein
MEVGGEENLKSLRGGGVVDDGATETVKCFGALTQSRVQPKVAPG